MPSIRRNLLIATVAAATSGSLLCANPQPASAASASVSLSIVSSHCSGWASWRGSSYSTVVQAAWVHGTVKHCVTKYKMADSDKSADYYLIELSSEYKVTRENSLAGMPNQKAIAEQETTSSKKASGTVYSGTKTFTSSKSCTSSFSVSAGIGPFSFSVSPSLCSGYTVKRTDLGAYGAGWKADYAGEAPSMETAYAMKVAEGTKPVFTSKFHRPYYTIKWNDLRTSYTVTPAWSTWTSID